jgi:GT2 family glycosyltransferase
MAQVLAPLIDLLKQGAVGEVIVVDDCSTDDTAEIARQIGAQVLSTRVNSGPAYARNLAAAHATGDIVWFVDADVVVDPCGVDTIGEAFRDRSVWAVFGSYDEAPPARNFASQYKNLIHRYYHQRSRAEASSFWTGCGAVRREKLLELGGFSARPEHDGCEDIELGYRIRDCGGRILCVKNIHATHLKQWTFRSLIATDIYLRALPWSRIMLSRSRLTDDLNVSLLERARAGFAWALLASLAALAFGAEPTWALLAGGLATLAGAPLLVFFMRTRGPLFALAALVFHQIYYIYSTVAFLWCWWESRSFYQRGPDMRSTIRQRLLGTN